MGATSGRVSTHASANIQDGLIEVVDPERARLNIIAHLLSRIPYKTAPHEKVKLPKRKTHDDGKKKAYEFKFIPEVS